MGKGENAGYDNDIKGLFPLEVAKILDCMVKC